MPTLAMSFNESSSTAENSCVNHGFWTALDQLQISKAYKDDVKQIKLQLIAPQSRNLKVRIPHQHDVSQTRMANLALFVMIICISQNSHSDLVSSSM